MNRVWTPAQQSAMRARGRTLLVSAAAGSGKTATLTERIIRRLTAPEDPADLSRLLIVTFTRAAAAELRERIGTALTDALRKDPQNRHLQKQLLSLGSAHISTIDAFVREPVKAHFAELGLPAKNRIADEAELAPLRERVMQELMEAYYIKYADATTGELFSLLNQNVFADLCDSLTPSKNDEALIPTFLALYERLLAFPDELNRLLTEAEELEQYANQDFFISSHGRVIQKWLQDFCVSAIQTLEDACRTISEDPAACKAYGSAFETDLRFVTALSNAQTYEEAYTYFRAYQNERLGALRGASNEMVALKEARTELVKSIKSIGKAYFIDSPESIARQMQETAHMCRVLHDFLTAYDARILDEKRARGISDFTDNRRYLLHLLRDEDGRMTPFAQELAAQYDEVYIDEYQDVDELQDEIFRLVGGTHRFMVGDIKQSIYGFRGADPSVFAGYRKKLPIFSDTEIHPSGNSIFMSDNFRCDESVIRVTNAICGHILRACPDSVGYTDADDLVFSKQKPCDGYVSPKAHISVLKRPPRDTEVDETDHDEEISAAKLEAIYVANQIASLLQNGATLSNGEPIRPRDIVILMRATTALSVYREALTAAGIPTGSDELDAQEAGRDILHGEDMMYLVNLLRVLDNPDQDIPLSEVLRAPFPGLSLDEILHIRCPQHKAKDRYSLFECLESYSSENPSDLALIEKIKSFLHWIDHYRALCTIQPATSILHFLGQDEHCACRKTEAFRYLYESARTCRTSTFVSLYAFLRYFEKKLLTTKNAVTTPNHEGTGGHVSLMTIHKSKGLEFPVCFVVRLGQTFNSASLSSDLIFAKETGIAMKLYRRGEASDSDTGVYKAQTQMKVDTTLRSAAALSVKLTEREEEMRVLYVAMTRARERLYLVGVGHEKTVHLREGDQYATLSCSNYLRWILAGLTAHPEIQDHFCLHYVPFESIVPCAPLHLTNGTPDTQTEDPTAMRYRRLAEMHREPTSMELMLGCVPTKVPASRMTEHLLDTCVFYDTDLLPDNGGKLPATSAGDSWCDAQSIVALRESLRLMISSDAQSVNEFELLFSENQRPTAAESGTAVHLFLQFCDYNRVVKYGLEEEVTRLAEEGFLNARTVQILDRVMLQGFFDSQFFAHTQEAIHVKRELRFNRFVPLRTLTTDPAFATALGDRTLYVQGSIDLLCEYEDGHIELCDYKTDYISDTERANSSLLARRMKEQHGEQLKQYVEAVWEMYGTRPTKVYIYSLPLREAVEIKL